MAHPSFKHLIQWDQETSYLLSSRSESYLLVRVVWARLDFWREDIFSKSIDMVQFSNHFETLFCTSLQL